MNIKKIFLIISFVGTVQTTDAVLKIFSSKILKGVPPIFTAIDTNDNHLLHELCKEYPNLIDSYLYPTDKPYRVPPITYAVLRNLQALKIILNHGTNPNRLDSANNSPLHWATKKGNFTDQEQTALIQLLNAGANIDIRNNHRETALFWAIRENALENIKTLLNHGALINIQNIYGNTPLHCAVESGTFAACFLLLKSGAHLDIKNKKGYTPLFLAVKKNRIQIIDLLLEHKANPFEKDNEGDTPVKWAEFYKKDGILYLFSLYKIYE